MSFKHIARAIINAAHLTLVGMAVDHAAPPPASGSFTATSGMIRIFGVKV